MVRNIFIMAIAIALASMAAMNALTSITKRKQADTSLNVPIFFNGIAAETVAANSIRDIITNNDNKLPQQLPDSLSALALKSFQSEPTTSSSIAILAIPQNSGKRRTLMEQAHKFSKRDQLVTGWLINDAIEKNDVTKLLAYYDISMRASSRTSNIILPLMVNALSNDLTIQPLYDILVNKPTWVRKFWNLASTSKESAKNAAILRSQLFEIGEDSLLYNDPALIRTLVSNNNYEEAIALWSRVKNNEIEKKKADIQAVSNYNFKKQPQLPPLDWQIYSNGEYGASISNNGLFLSAIQNSGGLFARQLIYLKPQLYQVKLDMNQAISSNHSLKIELICAEPIKDKPRTISIPISRKSVSRSLSNQGDICRYYWLNIRGRAGNGNGLDANIKSISISQNDKT